MKITESQIVNLCIRWLWLHGCYVWRQNTGAYKPVNSDRYIRFGIPGCADIIGVIGDGPMRGKFLAIECKSAKGKMSEHQIKFKEVIESKGGIYILAHSVDDLIANKRLVCGD